MAGTLYIVGTPIGNLEDVTLRALRVLREVDLIAAEDTRRTARLLQHYSIATPATSLHEHNEHGKTPHLVARLQAGTSIALVSDAGMPLVSDPGAALVTAARAAGIPIQVVPGPSAITAALALAGMSGPFSFAGFAPSSGQGRKDWMGSLGQTAKHCPVVFFEAPHRIARTLSELKPILGDRPILVAKEMTKVHELLVAQPIMEWLEKYSDSTAARGEFVVIVTAPAAGQDDRATAPDDAAIVAQMGDMTINGGMKPRAAAKALAKKYQVTADHIYDLYSRQRD